MSCCELLVVLGQTNNAFPTIQQAQDSPSIVKKNVQQTNTEQQF